MEEIRREETDYENYLLFWFYTFKSKKERERILYRNFVEVGQEVK